MKQLSARILVSLFVLAGAGAASAQGYPNRPIRVVEGFPPGGPSDIVVRLITDRFRQSTGQGFVVENRPGAGGHVATQEVARAAPDGYTLLSGADTQLTVNPHIFTKSGPAAAEKLVPIALLSQAVMSLACNPQLPAKNMAELAALSKSQALKYGSGGPGSPAHLTMEMVLKAAGARMTHVPYKGPAASVTALLGGEVDCVMGVSNAFYPFWRDKKVAVLGLSGQERSRFFPDIPTFSELGYRDQSPYFYSMLAAPAGTPAAALEVLQRELQAAMNDPEIRDRLAKADIVPIFMGVSDTQRIVKEQSDRFRRAVSDIGLSVE